MVINKFSSKRVESAGFESVGILILLPGSGQFPLNFTTGNLAKIDNARGFTGQLLLVSFTDQLSRNNLSP